jgi:hypothetical protein
VVTSSGLAIRLSMAVRPSTLSTTRSASFWAAYWATSVKLPAEENWASFAETSG